MSDLIAADFLRHSELDTRYVLDEALTVPAPDDERPAYADAAGDDEYGRE